MGSYSATKTLIITGGSRGIGLATVQLFQKQNWRIINLSRQPCPVEGVKNVFLDLSDLTQWTEHALSTVKSQLADNGSTIALVHNAGSFLMDRVDDIDLQASQKLFNINLFAPMWLNQAFLPLMAKDSSILYIGSTLSEKAVPNTFSYTSSKHGIVGMMKATCQDLVGRAIHTACICPGVTETEMLQDRFNQDPALRQALTQLSTFGRLVKPEEIAELVWFCANNPVINGSVIHGNLGQKER